MEFLYKFNNVMVIYLSLIYQSQQVKAYSINATDYVPKIYGISQNPNTKDYIMICQYIYYSGNKQIDNFIQKMQLKRRSHNDIVFEWIPYNQFNNIKEINKGDFATIHSAIWKDGPLLYYDHDMGYTRKPHKIVVLKCLYNSQNITNEFLDEV